MIDGPLKRIFRSEGNNSNRYGEAEIPKKGKVMLESFNWDIRYNIVHTGGMPEPIVNIHMQPDERSQNWKKAHRIKLEELRRITGPAGEFPICKIEIEKLDEGTIRTVEEIDEVRVNLHGNIIFPGGW